MKNYVVLSSMVFLTACNLPVGQFKIDPTGSPTSFAVPVAIDGNCGASGLQGLLNQPESALSDVSLPGNTRIIRPGMGFSKEADPNRLNIGIAEDGTIVHVACG